MDTSIVVIETCKCDKEKLNVDHIPLNCPDCGCPIVVGCELGSEDEPRNPPTENDAGTPITVGPSGDAEYSSEGSFPDGSHAHQSSLVVVDVPASLQSDIQSVDPPVPMLNPDNTPRFPEQSQNTVSHPDGHQSMDTQTSADIGNNSSQGDIQSLDPPVQMNNPDNTSRFPEQSQNTVSHPDGHQSMDTETSADIGNNSSQGDIQSLDPPVQMNNPDNTSRFPEQSQNTVSHPDGHQSMDTETSADIGNNSSQGDIQSLDPPVQMNNPDNTPRFPEQSHNTVSHPDGPQSMDTETSADIGNNSSLSDIQSVDPPVQIVNPDNTPRSPDQSQSTVPHPDGHQVMDTKTPAEIEYNSIQSQPAFNAGEAPSHSPGPPHGLTRPPEHAAIGQTSMAAEPLSTGPPEDGYTTGTGLMPRIPMNPIPNAQGSFTVPPNPLFTLMQEQAALQQRLQYVWSLAVQRQAGPDADRVIQDINNRLSQIQNEMFQLISVNMQPTASTVSGATDMASSMPQRGQSMVLPQCNTPNALSQSTPYLFAPPQMFVHNAPSQEAPNNNTTDQLANSTSASEPPPNSESNRSLRQNLANDFDRTTGATSALSANVSIHSDIVPANASSQIAVDIPSQQRTADTPDQINVQPSCGTFPTQPPRSDEYATNVAEKGSNVPSHQCTTTLVHNQTNDELSQDTSSTLTPPADTAVVFQQNTSQDQPVSSCSQEPLVVEVNQPSPSSASNVPKPDSQSSQARLSTSLHNDLATDDSDERDSDMPENVPTAGRVLEVSEAEHGATARLTEDMKEMDLDTGNIQSESVNYTNGKRRSTSPNSLDGYQNPESPTRSKRERLSVSKAEPVGESSQRDAYSANTDEGRSSTGISDEKPIFGAAQRVTNFQPNNTDLNVEREADYLFEETKRLISCVRALHHERRHEQSTGILDKAEEAIQKLVPVRESLKLQLQGIQESETVNTAELLLKETAVQFFTDYYQPVFMIYQELDPSNTSDFPLPTRFRNSAAKETTFTASPEILEEQLIPEHSDSTEDSIQQLPDIDGDSDDAATLFVETKRLVLHMNQIPQTQLPTKYAKKKIKSANEALLRRQTEWDKLKSKLATFEQSSDKESEQTVKTQIQDIERGFYKTYYVAMYDTCCRNSLDHAQFRAPVKRSKNKHPSTGSTDVDAHPGRLYEQTVALLEHLKLTSGLSQSSEDLLTEAEKDLSKRKDNHERAKKRANDTSGCTGKEREDAQRELNGIEKNFYKNHYEKLYAVYSLNPDNSKKFEPPVSVEKVTKQSQTTAHHTDAVEVARPSRPTTRSQTSEARSYLPKATTRFYVVPAEQFGNVAEVFIHFCRGDAKQRIKLDRREDGVWETSVDLSKIRDATEYKYQFNCVNTEDCKENLIWEDFGKKHGGLAIVNRALTVKEMKRPVIYDGIALPAKPVVSTNDKGKGFLSTLKAKIVSAVSTDPKTKWRTVEKLRGLCLMLPKITAECFLNNSAADFISMIQDIEARQTQVFNGFYYWQHWNSDEISKVLEDFVGKLREFVGQLGDDCEPRVIINSTLVLLHFANVPRGIYDYLKSDENTRSLVQILLDETQIRLILLRINQALAAAKNRKPFRMNQIKEWIGDTFTGRMDSIMRKLERCGDSWVSLVPILHGFYWEMLMANDKGIRDNQPVWWGEIGHMTQLIEQSRSTETERWRTWLTTLAPFADSDPFALRTFLAAISGPMMLDILHNGIGEISDFPVDALLGCFSHLKLRYAPEKVRQNLYIWLSKRLLTIVQDPESGGDTQKSLQIIAVETFTLVKMFWDMFAYNQGLKFSIALHLLVLDNWKSISPNDDKLLAQSFSDLVSLTLKQLAVERYRCFGFYDQNKMIEVLEDLFECGDDLKLIREAWRSECTKAFNSCLDKVGEWRIVDCYLQTSTKCPEMTAALFELAMLHARTLLNSAGYDLGRNAAKVATIINHAIEQTWTKVNRLESSLAICLEVLQWNSFAQIYNFTADHKDEVKLSEKSQTLLKKIEAAFIHTFQRLEDHSITVGDFTKLNDHTAGLSDVCSCFEAELQSQGLQVSGYIESINRRLKEFDSFKEAIRRLFVTSQNFLAESTRTRVDRWVKLSIAGMELRSLFDDRGRVINPDLDEGFRAAATQHGEMHQRKLYTSQLQELLNGRKDASLDDVTNAVDLALNRHKEYIDLFSSGKLTSDMLARLKDRVYQGQIKDLLNEVERDMDENLESRKRQIEICDNLVTYRTGARAVLDLRETFGIANEFEEIRQLAKSGDGSLELRHVTEDILTSANDLNGINERQIDCLKQFSSSLKFVKWARKEVPMREIKVFVELATQTLGEDDFAVQRVDHLMNALNGYSAMIYNLKPDTTDFKTFMEICRSVWKELKATPQLQEDLKYAAKELETWQELKSNLDGMEIATISQADSINKTGRFVVGCNTSTQQNPRLNDVIKLTCELDKRSKEGNKRNKTFKAQYSAEREQNDSHIKGSLEELQEKLTLIAGDKQRQNKDTIDRFDRTRDTVMKLGQAYIELHNDGCILFDDLEITINNRDRFLVQMLFKGMVEPIQIIRKTPNETPIEHIDRVHRFMVDCVNSWRGRLEDSRKLNPILNHFTTAQLVLLRKDLGRLIYSANHQETYREALSLLELVNKTSVGEVAALGLTYSKQKQTDELPEDEDMPDGIDEETVDDLEERGYSRENIIQAIMSLGAGKPYRDYTKWIAENDELLMEMDTENIAANLLRKVDDDSDFISKLERVWEEFLNTTCTSSTQFLSLDKLAWILKKLKEKSTGRLQRQRRTPNWIERGKPNLITCGQDEMYKLMLALYMADENAENPTRSEVLLCTSTTTVEEVEIFMYRAITDDHSLYTMVNTQRLSNAHCRRIEDIIYSSKDHRAKNYVIAFLCDKNASEARIRSYLSKYQVLFPTSPEIEECQKYVKCLLNHAVTRDVSARSIDPERLSCRVIRSDLAGVGKSLKCRRMRENFVGRANDVVIPIYKTVDVDAIMEMLTDRSTTDPNACNIIHFDVSFEVQDGVDDLLTNLVILKSLCNSRGRVWHLRPQDYYMIECMPYKKNGECVHQIINLLPTTWCRPPTGYGGKTRGDAPDPEILMSAEWQRVLKFLLCHKQKHLRYDIRVVPQIRNEAVQLLTEFCGLQRPSWSELTHFVKFLSFQLEKVDSSPFCSLDMLDQGYSPPGFREFVVRFMIVMAQDFATRSLAISEESPGLSVHDLQQRDNERLMEMLSIKRKWESSNHPYLFFNEDSITFSFIGFVIQDDATKSACQIIDSETGQPLHTRLTFPRTLKATLEHRPYNMNLAISFSSLSKHQKLEKMQEIMVRNPHLYNTGGAGITDPDVNYELTLDNVKKILAIHQRIRVGIPVIIMGDTGCGKTKLIDYASKLQVPDQLRKNGPDDKGPNKVTNMITVKVHGGTTEQHIHDKVIEAQRIAKDNLKKCRDYATSRGWPKEEAPTVYTVLFLDEANTTEAIGLVKEVLCDGRILGVPLEEDSGLKIVAACNPYRKHKDGMITKLRQAGLGYFVNEQQTTDRFGHIPMRHLVYRVQALSQSLLPLVWDFGTLTANVEKQYISQMLTSSNQERMQFGSLTGMVSQLVCETHQFMRQQDDECSFVSLRDVNRLIDITAWFLKISDILFPMMRGSGGVEEDCNSDESEDDEENQSQQTEDELVAQSLLLALGVCYLARLEPETRERYAKRVSRFIEQMFPYVGDGAEYFLEQIELCQDVIIEEIIREVKGKHKNIAKNKALKENAFMMLVCIEQRIPLFLVGKPGSSKSLSKAMVIDAMDGRKSDSPLLQRMKQTYMVSFQCSRLATPNSIVSVFKEGASKQKSRQDKLDEFVSIVVLDEVGLAEDSANMPLKALHPLLEDGCEGHEEPAEWKRCAFIGISNWALDPAKMNRGIFVQRGTPANDELITIAQGIRESATEEVKNEVDTVLNSLVNGYKAICEVVKPSERDLTEFFGLRDFYSLVKMVLSFAKETCNAGEGRLYRSQLEHAIRRNFGGFDSSQIDCLQEFKRGFPDWDGLPDVGEDSSISRPPTQAVDLIQSSLQNSVPALQEMENRYLLVLTENLSILGMILERFQQDGDTRRPEIIFGSYFRRDIRFTQVCHNINLIKNCMAVGKPVILLNLDDLYESLYDTLNQYFSTLGSTRFVGLGLGTHRVKARIDNNFRLVVIADSKKVYKEFPIPLINRLEKHFISINTLLTEDQRKMKEELEDWASSFVRPTSRGLHQRCPSNCLCGRPLNQPIRLPCSHYIGKCCERKIFREEMPRECPYHGCGQREIPEEFEWNVDETALKQREVFEDSMNRPETAFIGYSSEMVALAVMQADASQSSDKGEILKSAKTALLEVCTADSVLRLKHTDLLQEQQWINDVYFKEQQHEMLSEYMQNVIRHHGKKHLFVQVTTFAKLLNKEQVQDLNEQLYTPGQNVFDMTVNDFDTEAEFVEKVRNAYQGNKEGERSILLLQCESSHDYPELLDSVRHILLRESETAGTQAEHVITVLLLNMPRGVPFVGYQGTPWHCVHIDDPSYTQRVMPLIKECLKLQPSGILDQVIRNTKMDHDKWKPAEKMETDDPDTNQDSDGMDETMERIDKSDQLLNRNINVESIIIPCLPQAMSLVERHGKEGLVDLREVLRDSQLHDIHVTLLERAKYLLSKSEEKQQLTQYNWVYSKAAKASNMKKSETLRSSLELCMYREISPGLAAVIALCEPYMNLALLRHHDPWRKHLWRDLFVACCEDRLQYEQIANEAGSLPDTFKLLAPSAGDQEFKSRLPFSWIIKHIINTMLSSPATQSSAERHLEETSVGQALSAFNSHLHEVLDDYIPDFVHLSHPSHNQREHELVGKTIASEMKQQLTLEGDRNPQTICGMMVLIHRVFEKTSVSFKRLSSVVNVVDTCKEVLDKYMDKVALGVPCYLVAIRAALSQEDSMSYLKLAPTDKTAREWILRVEGLLGLLQDHVQDRSASEATESYHDGPLSEERDNAMASLEKECHRLRTNLMLKKLYIQHVVLPMPTPTEGDGAGIKAMENLKQLASICKTKDYADYGKTRAYTDIVELLTESLLRHAKKAFGLKKSTCPVVQCGGEMISPFKLSCSHYVCEKCALMEGFRCPLCKEINTSNQYIPEEDSTLRKRDVESLSQYRQYLNVFFMEFVSQIVFWRPDGAGRDEPEPRVISHLVNCITHQSGTRRFSMFNSSDVIDPTPVVRSFLLKLLLKSSLDGQEQDATDFRAEIMLLSFVNETNDGATDLRAQTMALLVDCLKDDMDTNLNEYIIAESLEACRDIFSDKVDELSLEHLQTVAQSHYLIKTVASALIEGEACDETVLENFELFLETCYDPKDPDQQITEQPRMYIARMVIAEYGESKLKDISAREHLQFMLPRPVLEALHTFSVPDMLKLCSFSNYGLVLTDLTDLLQPSQSQEQLDNKLNNFITNHANVANQNDLLKALFTRITRYTNTEVPPNQNTVNDLLAKLRNSQISPTSKIWMEKLLSNRLDAVFNLSNSEGTNLAMMALHMYTCTENKRGVVYPFVQLITSPQACQQLYLPTMPDNPIEEIKAVATKQAGLTQAHRCPNGHVYYIADCGRPVTTGVCPVSGCRAKIGGLSYQYAAGNATVTDYSEYITKPGYLCNVTETDACPERSLNVQSCAILRCLVHLSLLASAVHQPQPVRILLGAPGDVMAYLATRVQTGIQQIAATSNLSREHCITLLHLVMNKISDAPTTANVSLNTKDLRRDWETEFNRMFITAIFNKDATEKVTASQLKLQGTNQDLSALCEPTPEVDESNKLNTSYLWIYNRPLNLNIIDQEIPENQGQRLKQFIHHLPTLKAMSNLPVVLKLLREMAEAFHCKITKDKAESCNVATFLHEIAQVDDERSERLTQMVEVFMDTWRMVIPSMEESERLPLGDALISILPLSRASNQSRPSALHQLINHLVAVNNSFLEDTGGDTEIPVQSVSQSGLITVPGGSEELMSLILRHSQYEFGQRMERSRDWAKVDDELLQRYLVGKRRVSTTSVDQLPVYQFPHEFTLVKLLTQISPKQTQLNDGQREALIRDSSRYGINELNHLLTNLATMIQICCNISVFNQEEPIVDAFRRNFDADSKLLQNVPGLCLCHVSEAWVLLRFQQAKALLRNEQQPFEEIDQKCLDPLDKQIGSHLKDYLVSYNSTQTHALLNDLCEFIILKLNNVTAAKYEPEFFNQSLDDYLLAYLQEKDDDTEFSLADRLKLNDPSLKIPISQAVATWKFIYLIYTTPVDQEN